MEVLRAEPKEVKEGFKCLTCTAKVVNEKTDEVESVDGFLVVEWPTTVRNWLVLQGEERTLADINRARAIAIQANMRAELQGKTPRPRGSKAKLAEQVLALVAKKPEVLKSMDILITPEIQAVLDKINAPKETKEA